MLPYWRWWHKHSGRLHQDELHLQIFSQYTLIVWQLLLISKFCIIGNKHWKDNPQKLSLKQCDIFEAWPYEAGQTLFKLYTPVGSPFMRPRKGAWVPLVTWDSIWRAIKIFTNKFLQMHNSLWCFWKYTKLSFLL